MQKNIVAFLIRIYPQIYSKISSIKRSKTKERNIIGLGILKKSLTYIHYQIQKKNFNIEFEEIVQYIIKNSKKKIKKSQIRYILQKIFQRGLDWIVQEIQFFIFQKTSKKSKKSKSKAKSLKSISSSQSSSSKPQSLQSISSAQVQQQQFSSISSAQVQSFSAISQNQLQQISPSKSSSSILSSLSLRKSHQRNQQIKSSKSLPAFKTPQRQSQQQIIKQKITTYAEKIQKVQKISKTQINKVIKSISIIIELMKQIQQINENDENEKQINQEVQILINLTNKYKNTQKLLIYKLKSFMQYIISKELINKQDNQIQQIEQQQTLLRSPYLIRNHQQNQQQSYSKKIKFYRNKLKYLTKKFEQQCNIIEKAKQIIEYLEQQIALMKNKLSNLRGNIQVICRIRRESQITQGKLKLNYEIIKNKQIIIKQLKKNYQTKTEKKVSYFFDKIYAHPSQQIQIFNEVKSTIELALTNVNVIIFAYGQAGSGKTFTMIGPNQSNKNEQRGVIPRCIEFILQSIQKQEKDLKIQIAIHEIDKNKVKNLKNQQQQKKPTFIKITNKQEIQKIFQQCISNRKVDMNSQSSRSHLVFNIRISTNKQASKYNSLVFVDLAGTKKSNFDDKQRLREAKYINSSLFELKGVIRSIKEKKRTIFFRNSMLTWFLEPYLQKGSKAVMIVSISPQAADESQTINSLKFATDVRSCEMGRIA